MTRSYTVRSHSRHYKTRSVRVRPHTRHLYRNRQERAQNLRSFENRYGKSKGKYVYGAVVGKVRREQLARRFR